MEPMGSFGEGLVPLGGKGSLPSPCPFCMALRTGIQSSESFWGGCWWPELRPRDGEE